MRFGAAADRVFARAFERVKELAARVLPDAAAAVASAPIVSTQRSPAAAGAAEEQVDAERDRHPPLPADLVGVSSKPDLAPAVPHCSRSSSP